MDEITDSALMAAAAGGDGRALDALYRRYRPQLRGYLGRFTPDDASADDLVQETFLRVMRYGASFDPARSFRAWIFGVARNVGLRAAADGPEVDSLDDVVISAPDHPGREYRSREAVEALQAALGALAEDDRRVLVLGKIEGRTYREVGRILGVTEGAVKVRVFRALQRLRTELRTRGNPGGWLDEH